MSLPALPPARSWNIEHVCYQCRDFRCPAGIQRTARSVRPADMQRFVTSRFVSPAADATTPRCGCQRRTPGHSRSAPDLWRCICGRRCEAAIHCRLVRRRPRPWPGPHTRGCLPPLALAALSPPLSRIPATSSGSLNAASFSSRRSKRVPKAFQRRSKGRSKAFRTRADHLPRRPPSGCTGAEPGASPLATRGAAGPTGRASPPDKPLRMGAALPLAVVGNQAADSRRGVQRLFDRTLIELGRGCAGGPRDRLAARPPGRLV